MGEDDPPDTAGNRAQPAYDPLGIRVGSFTLQPSVSATTTLDTNVFARARARRSDASVTVVPALSVRSTSPGRSFRLEANARLRRYAELTDQNDDQYRVESVGAYELGAASRLSARVGWSEATVSRGTFENGLQVGAPLRQQRLWTELGVQHRFNRLRVNLRVTGERGDYADVRLDDGGVIDQDFRDVNRIGGSLGLSYEVSARIAAQIQARIEKFDYRDVPSRNDRDATNYSVLAGARYEVTSLLRAEFGVGLRRHDFRDPLRRNQSGLALNGTLRWYPTPLLSVRFDLAQTTSTSSFQAINAVNSTRAKLEADYELKRNLLVTLGSELTQDEFGDGNGRSNLFSLDGRLQWKANRWLRVTPSLTYERRGRNVTGAAAAFSSYRFMLGVTVVR